MNGNFEPEERVMSDVAWEEDGVMDRVQEIIETLGWDSEDDIQVEIGGTVVSGIHQGENYNKKWATPFGVRKYNKDAFIIISNQSRRDLTGSKPMDREHKPQHPYTPPSEEQEIVVNMDGGVGGSWEVKEES